MGMPLVSISRDIAGNPLSYLPFAPGASEILREGAADFPLDKGRGGTHTDKFALYRKKGDVMGRYRLSTWIAAVLLAGGTWASAGERAPERPLVLRERMAGMPPERVNTPVERWSLNVSAGAAVRLWTSPTVSTLLVQTDNGTLLSIERETGLTRWQFQLEGDVSDDPFFTEKIVHLISRGHLLAIDARGGELLWRVRLPFGAAGGPVVLGDQPLPPLVDERDRVIAEYVAPLIFIPGADATVHAVSITKSVWPPLAPGKVRSPADIVVVDHRLNVLWAAKQTDSIVGGLSLVGDRIYFADTRSNVLSLPAQTTAASTQAARISGSSVAGLTASADRLLLPLSNGSLHCFFSGPIWQAERPTAAMLTDWRCFVNAPLRRKAQVATHEVFGRVRPRSFALVKAAGGPLYVVSIDRTPRKDWDPNTAHGAVNLAPARDERREFDLIGPTEAAARKTWLLERLDWEAPDGLEAVGLMMDSEQEAVRRAVVVLANEDNSLSGYFLETGERAWDLPAPSGFRAYAPGTESPLVFASVDGGRRLVALGLPPLTSRRSHSAGF